MRRKNRAKLIYLGALLSFFVAAGTLWQKKAQPLSPGPVVTLGQGERLSYAEIAGYDSTEPPRVLESSVLEEKSFMAPKAAKSPKKARPIGKYWANKQYFEEGEGDFRITSPMGGKKLWTNLRALLSHPVTRSVGRFLGFYLGVTAGFHYNQAMEQSAALKREAEAALFVEYDLGKAAPWLAFHLRGSVGYSMRPYVFAYGEVVADYLTFGLSLLSFVPLSDDYRLFLDTGFELAQIRSYNYTSYEVDKEYQISMPEWLPLLKVSLGLERELGNWGRYFFELGLKYSLASALNENAIFVSHDDMSARDVYLNRQRQLMLFFFLGWKTGIF